MALSFLEDVYLQPEMQDKEGMFEFRQKGGQMLVLCDVAPSRKLTFELWQCFPKCRMLDCYH